MFCILTTDKFVHVSRRKDPKKQTIHTYFPIFYLVSFCISLHQQTQQRHGFGKQQKCSVKKVRRTSKREGRQKSEIEWKNPVPAKNIK